MQKGCVDFHIAEYVQLRNEILSNVKATYNSVIYISISNALIFAWLSTQETSVLFPQFIYIIAWIPLLLTIIGLILNRTRDIAIHRIAIYLKMIEEKIAFDGFGWEIFLENHRMKILRTRNLFYFIFVVQALIAFYLGVAVSFDLMGK